MCYNYQSTLGGIFLIKSIKELTSAAEAYVAARKTAAEFKKTQEECAARLKEYLVKKSVQSLVAGGFKLTLTEFLTKKFDLDKFKADHPKIKFAEYETETVGSRLGVKEV
jgi:hypothetical protein